MSVSEKIYIPENAKIIKMCIRDSLSYRVFFFVFDTVLNKLYNVLN